MKNKGEALSALYDTLGINTDKYLDDTLFPLLKEKIVGGEPFSILEFLTEGDVKIMCIAAMVLKKITFVKEQFADKELVGDANENAIQDAITERLGESASLMQQVALLVAALKGLSDYEPDLSAAADEDGNIPEVYTRMFDKQA